MKEFLTSVAWGDGESASAGAGRDAASAESARGFIFILEYAFLSASSFSSQALS